MSSPSSWAASCSRSYRPSGSVSVPLIRSSLFIMSPRHWRPQAAGPRRTPIGRGESVSRQYQVQVAELVPEVARSQGFGIGAAEVAEAGEREATLRGGDGAAA